MLAVKTVLFFIQHLPVAMLYETPKQASDPGEAEHRSIHSVRFAVTC